MDNSYNKYPKGSEWRKWDLHLHTPYTNLNSYKASDDAFIEKVVNAGISAVALTNYFCFKDDEFELKKKLEAKGITVFFNLELRSTYTNNDQKCCDIHVIFSNDITKGDLDHFCARLNLNVGPTKKSASHLNNTDFQTAVVDFEHLKATLNDDASNLKNRHLIGFLSRGHGNARSSRSFEYLNANSDFLLHSSDSKENLQNDRKFWIENDKPLFQSSDAHNLESIGEKYSWIKADPTFEGLKQVIYEPEERINLETTKPDDKPDYQVIDCVELNGKGRWEGRIDFNENLNTIIGGRSTGKSTLLASIAHKLGKFTTENEAFESHVKGQLSSVVLHWKDGESNVERDVDYFPQNHMHTLACDQNRRNNLVKSIISKKDKANLLDHYRSFVSSEKMRQESLISHLFAIQDEANLIKIEIEEIGDKSGIEAEIQKLKEQISEFSSELSPQEKDTYEILSSQISELNNKLLNYKTYTNELASIKVANFFKEVDLSELISHPEYRIEFKDKYDALKAAFQDSWLQFTTEKVTSIEAEETRLIADIEKLKEDPIFARGQRQLNNNESAMLLSKKLQAEQEKLHKINVKHQEYARKLQLVDDLLNEIALIHDSYKLKATNLSKTLRFKESDLEVTVKCDFDSVRIEAALSEQLMQRSKTQKQVIGSFCKNYPKDPKSTVKQLLKNGIDGKLDCKGSNTPQSVLTHVLCPNTYRQNYELTYQNDKFDQMSQGKQAFVILKLLLEFSDKTCPILIDQPEDSLDNRAIFNELVEYLKRKKKDRQIILVTHNANVVVSADSEQIIVANQQDVRLRNKSELKFQYVSGGIEHSREKSSSEPIFLYSQGIRQHICDVLEGGNEAFQKREKKYQLVR